MRLYSNQHKNEDSGRRREEIAESQPLPGLGVGARGSGVDEPLDDPVAVVGDEFVGFLDAIERPVVCDHLG